MTSGLGLFGTAFLLLAGMLILGIAGTAALQESHQDAVDVANGDNDNESVPRVITMADDLQSGLMSVLPWFALVSVPIGIAGMLAVTAKRFSSSPGGRRR